MFYFHNKGVLPLLAVTTLGVSVKETDSPIGRFGTGLKYTIAGILRSGGNITIKAGPDKFAFLSKTEGVRGKPFQIVTMSKNGGDFQPLGFTTDLGKHWASWMFVRELYSNCVDEAGSWGFGAHPCADDETLVSVECPPVELEFKNMSNFILTPDEKYLVRTPTIEILMQRQDGKGRDLIYYQGIRVGQLQPGSRYRYNIVGKFDGLTEDRTITYNGYVSSMTGNAIMGLGEEDKDVIQEFATVLPGADTFERDIATRLGTGGTHTPYHRTVKEIYDNRPGMLFPSLWRDMAQNYDTDHESKQFKLSVPQQDKFNRALAFIKRIGFDKELTWRFISPDSNTEYGFVENGKIYITTLAFDGGTTQLAMTMIEEYAHAVLGETDYTRKFQDFLLSKIVALGELVNGEGL